MRHRVPILAALLLTPLAALHAAEPSWPANRPNVILIYSDDQGFADVRAQGVDADIRTPNLDVLAQEGVRFTRGYVSAPQCVPSRAGVITGRYQQRFGVEENGKGPLPLEELTIAERLKPAGYVSCQVGKWHLEGNRRESGAKRGTAAGSHAGPTFQPFEQGFDEYFTGPLNHFIASHDLSGHKLPDAPRALTDKRFRCVWQSEAALGFIDRHAREPFFLYLAYFTPHVPLESPDPWFAQTPAHLPKERRQALAMIAAMDDGIGRIRARLRERGIEKNTLVFFISDNGAPLRKGAWNGSLNKPLVGEKGMLTDGGIRTPFLAAWPGTLPAGKVYEHPVINLDVAATAVALAGLPHDATLDGVDLVPFLTGQHQAAPHDALFWRWRTQVAVLEFPWKLIRLGPQEQFLFDVTQPGGESAANNLIAKHPDIAARLQSRLKAWSDSLRPPGLPTGLVDQDATFFREHGLSTTVAPQPQDAKAARAEARSGVQGWLCRNGTLAVKQGGLVVTPAAGAAPPAFITQTGLDLAAPVTATLRVRCAGGGSGSVSWRLHGQREFVAGQNAAFDLAGSPDWQTVRVTLPGQGHIIHLRLQLPTKGSATVSSIELRAADAQSATAWRFDKHEAEP